MPTSYLYLLVLNSHLVINSSQRAEASINSKSQYTDDSKRMCLLIIKFKLLLGSDCRDALYERKTLFTYKYSTLVHVLTCVNQCCTPPAFTKPAAAWPKIAGGGVDHFELLL